MLDEHAMPWKLGCMTLWAAWNQGSKADGAQLGAGDAAHTEIVAASELHGLAMDSGDECYWMIDAKELASKADLSKSLAGQVLCSHSQAVADTGVEWIASITGAAERILVPNASASPDGQIIFRAQTFTAVAAAIEKTEKQSFDTEDKDFADDEVLCVNVELQDRGDTDVNEIVLVGLRIWYTKQMFHASGRKQGT